MSADETLMVFDATSANLPIVASHPAYIKIVNFRPVLAYPDGGVDYYTTFLSVTPYDYTNRGIEVRITWSGAISVAGDVVWSVAFEDCDTDHEMLSDDFAAALVNTETAPANNQVLTTILFFTNTESDSLIVNRIFRLKVMRKGTDGGDTMTGTAYILRIEIRER